MILENVFFCVALLKEKLYASHRQMFDKKLLFLCVKDIVQL